jgi:protein-L-isoaspartate(D-aspartate) O-methyltransferase
VPAEAAGQAYLDEPIRIPRGQVTTQPSLIAAMVAALGLTGAERVLEVGTGLGFQTAILARLAHRVVSIERVADLAAQARANLAAAGVGGVTVVVGDGTLGVPEHAPYQAIVVSARLSLGPGAAGRAARRRWAAGAPGRPGRPRAGHRLPQGR